MYAPPTGINFFLFCRVLVTMEVPQSLARMRTLTPAQYFRNLPPLGYHALGPPPMFTVMSHPIFQNLAPLLAYGYQPHAKLPSQIKPPYSMLPVNLTNKSQFHSALLHFPGKHLQQFCIYLSVYIFIRFHWLAVWSCGSLIGCVAMWFTNWLCGHVVH